MTRCLNFSSPTRLFLSNALRRIQIHSSPLRFGSVTSWIETLSALSYSTPFGKTTRAFRLVKITMPDLFGAAVSLTCGLPLFLTIEAARRSRVIIHGHDHRFLPPPGESIQTRTYVSSVTTRVGGILFRGPQNHRSSTSQKCR